MALTFNGRTQSQAAWARELGVGESAMRWRLRNWGRERALTEHVHDTGPKTGRKYVALAPKRTSRARGGAPTPAQQARRAELMRGRPQDCHPMDWIRRQAERASGGGRGMKGSDDGARHGWQRRVSAIYHRMLAEVGVVVEGADGQRRKQGGTR